MIIIMTTIQTSQIKSGKPWLQKLLRGQAHSPEESVEMVFVFRVFGIIAKQVSCDLKHYQFTNPAN